MTLLVPALTLGAVVLMANSAAAAYDDSFSVWTTDTCGAVEFVDYGPGAPGGGNNDDYAVVHDYCSDGHGVKAYAWLTDGNDDEVHYLGGGYNGNGLAGAPVTWDPFGNVLPGDSVGLKVCLVDGNDDPTPFRCDSYTRTSFDG